MTYAVRRSAFPPEWRFQACVAVCNSMPWLIGTISLGYLVLVFGALTAFVGLFVGAPLVLVLFGYAWYGLVIADGLWRQSPWAFRAAVRVFAINLLIFGVLGSTHPLPILDAPTRQPPLPWELRTGPVIWTIFHLMTVVNVLALVYFALRRKEFSTSA